MKRAALMSHLFIYAVLFCVALQCIKPMVERLERDERERKVGGRETEKQTEVRER